MFDTDKTRLIWLPCGEEIVNDILSHFDTIPERDGHTYKRTDRIPISRVVRGSGPSMGRVVSGRLGSDLVTTFSVLSGSGWVGSSVKNRYKYAIYMQEIRQL